MAIADEAVEAAVEAAYRKEEYTNVDGLQKKIDMAFARAVLEYHIGKFSRFLNEVEAGEMLREEWVQSYKPPAPQIAAKSLVRWRILCMFGPVMYVRMRLAGSAACVWWDSDGRLNSATFPLDELEPFPEAPIATGAGTVGGISRLAGNEFWCNHEAPALSSCPCCTEKIAPGAAKCDACGVSIIYETTTKAHGGGVTPAQVARARELGVSERELALATSREHIEKLIEIAEIRVDKFFQANCAHLMTDRYKEPNGSVHCVRCGLELFGPRQTVPKDDNPQLVNPDENKPIDEGTKN